jgi:hypothetical protein
MSHVIGRGRYARETYPGRDAGGGATAVVPLSRQRFIDGDTTQPGPGAAAAPFATIAAFMTARGPVSVADATANFVGWVMPTLLGYVADVSFPAYASTELRADSLTFIGGTSTAITGNVTWNNVAGAFTAVAAILSMHNLSVSGNFTVTDDASAPPSAIVFGSDESTVAASISGQFVSNTTQNLSSVSFFHAIIAGGIDTGTSSSSAGVVLDSCSCLGSISANALTALDSIINVSAISVNDNQNATFRGCEFQHGSTPALRVLSGARFDGASWQSFSEAQGTRVTGTIVLVVDGYSGAAVEGAALTAASTDVSLNGTGATAGFTGENSGNHYSTTNGTPTTVNLKTGGGELPGDTILITKTDLGANAIAVKNNTGVTLATIPANSRGFVLAQFQTVPGDWVLAEGGSLAA